MMNRKNLFRISIVVGAAAVIATALIVSASVGNPSATGKNGGDKSSGSITASTSKSSATEQPTAASLSEQTASASIASTGPAFSLKQLAAYNGKNGQPAYVAYKGIVYDLTAVSNWSSGKHNGISAGTDVTDVFSSSPHAVSILKMGFIVGTMEGFTGTMPARTAASQSGTPYPSGGMDDGWDDDREDGWDDKKDDDRDDGPDDKKDDEWDDDQEEDKD